MFSFTFANNANGASQANALQDTEEVVDEGENVVEDG